MTDKQFKVSGDKMDLLEKTIELIFLQSGSYLTARSWKVIDGVGLVFYWYRSIKDAHVLPVDMKADGVFTIAKQWITSAEAINMIKPHRYRGGDGSYSKGWEVTNRVQEHEPFYQLLIINPIEIYYGK